MLKNETMISSLIMAVKVNELSGQLSMIVRTFKHLNFHRIIRNVEDFSISNTRVYYNKASLGTTYRL